MVDYISSRWVFSLWVELILSVKFKKISQIRKEMWRSLLKQSFSVLGRRKPLKQCPFQYISSNNNNDVKPPLLLFSHILPFSSSSETESESQSQSPPLSSKDISFPEAKRLMRLVNVEALKMKLGMQGKEVIGYKELLEACETMGIARSLEEAIAFARVLDDAGVVLLFRDKVYLHPDKVVDLVRRAVPLALTPEDDPMRGELKMLLEKKEEIDMLAHKQVRRILWCGLGISILQIGLFFRLTFWEFSWDVMEPIAFFSTTTGITLGYAYFLFTARDPTYQDLMKRLFLSRQRKLFKRHNFDVNKFKELQLKCKIPYDACTSLKNRTGLELDLEDALHRD